MSSDSRDLETLQYNILITIINWTPLPLLFLFSSYPVADPEFPWGRGANFLWRVPYFMENAIKLINNFSVAPQDQPLNSVYGVVSWKTVRTILVDGETFAWTPTKTLMNNSKSAFVQFIATDSQGMARLYAPTIYMCACDKGECMRKYTEDVRGMTSEGYHQPV